MNAPKPKPEDIKPKDIKSKNNKSKDNKSKDNKSKDNKSKDNKSKDNKPHETIDLRDDNDESCVLGFLFCVFLVSLGMVYNKLTYETFQSLPYTSQPNDNFWSPPASIFVTINIYPLYYLMKILEFYLSLLIAFVEKIDETITKCEIPALVVISIFDLMVILSVMLPKMTTDQCKKVGEMVGRRLHYHFYGLAMVSF